MGGVRLRICYSEGSEPKHEALVKDVEMEIYVDDRLLNDPDLYDYGDDWQRASDVMPEFLDVGCDWSYFADRQRREIKDMGNLCSRWG